MLRAAIYDRDPRRSSGEGVIEHFRRAPLLLGALSPDLAESRPRRHVTRTPNKEFLAMCISLRDGCSLLIERSMIRRNLPSGCETSTKRKGQIRMKLLRLFCVVPMFLAVPLIASAQSTLTPLNVLIDNGSTLTAGDVTFSNFSIPKIQPANLVSIFPPEFNDIAVSAGVNSDGTVFLSFVAIDPATGQPSPLITSPTAAGDLIRAVNYTVTVNNTALRLRSVDQAFGPGTTITGNSAVVNGQYAVEPVSVVYDQLMFDSTTAPPEVLRATALPSADGSGTFSGTGGILMPGGILTTYNMDNEFGLIKGHLGFDPGGTLDSITETFTLTDADSPVPVVTPQLLSLVPNSSGIVTVVLTDFAQEGGAVIGLASGNTAALQLPASITIPQGYKLNAFPVSNATVDAPTTVNISATLGGQTITQAVTVSPATPLAIAGFQGFALITPKTVGSLLQTTVTSTGTTLVVALNRENFSDTTIQLSSSNPALAPVQSSLTIPAFSTPGDFRVASANVPFQLVNVDTPVTFTATLNGVPTTTVVTIPKTVDSVSITKAELVVKNGQLKVEALGSVPSATLGLFNATTGQFIGNMTLSGLSGTSGKFSFQGTVSPVTTLLLRSNFSGTNTAGVAQK
jgi:hypothetical protein